MVQNWRFFNFFISGNIAKANRFYDILERKNVFLGYKNNKLKKSNSWDFSKGVSPWFWSEMENFSTFSFLGNIAKANEFYDILERKNDFLGYKTNKFKTPKIEIFPKGLVHGFSQKLHIFKLFYFRQYRQGKWVLWYSRTKKQLSRL